MNATKPVLVAGDDPLIVELLRLVLALHGYPVITISDCEQIPHHRVLSVALLDLDPVTAEGGVRIRSLHETLRGDVPIIGLTSDDDRRSLACEFDVHTWFPKPFDIDRLLATVQRLARQ